jgi:general secretion pathway protein A
MYAAHFRLTEEPFSLTPDPAYLYLSSEHREALAAIQYGLLAGRGFSTLIGEVGTGKTTLLYSLLSQIGPEVETAYLAYTAQSFEDLLGTLLRDLRVEAKGDTKGALLAALNEHLLRRADQGRTVAIVIDEAQGLSDSAFEELRLLSNFESYTRKLLQIVLVGQPELQDRLRQPQLRQLRERVGVRAIINPLSEAEMARYIEHRLQCAGGSTATVFEPAAVTQIVRRTAGIPRRANILCHNALLFAYGRGVPRVTVRIAREAIAEMDERRPGLRRRVALRRVASPRTLWRWMAAAVAAIALVLYAVSRSAVAPVAARVPMSSAGDIQPRAPTATAAAPAKDTPAPSAEPGSAGPGRQHEDERRAPSSPPTRPATPARASGAAEGADESVGESRGANPWAVTVPQGSSLTHLLHQLYGDELSTEHEQALFAEVRRLNPQVRDLNMIVAGDLLRLPPRGNPGSGEQDR